MTTRSARPGGLADKTLLQVLARRLRQAASICESAAEADTASFTAAPRAELEDLADHPAIRRLIEAAGTDGSRTGSGSRSPSWEIRLLGGFSVTMDGCDATPARGNGAAIVKLLALRGPLCPDALVDLLWPDADAAVGAARLRNTLSRLRRTTGEIVVRRAGLVALHPAARVDAVEFLDAASAALHECRGGAPAAVDRVDDTLRGFGGELLPGDRYVGWFDHDRERIVRRYLELSDVAQTDAERRGDLDAAAHVLEMALAVDPYDERRAVRLARHLVDLGHRAAGRWAVERALTITRDLGLAPSAELCAVAAAVTTRSERLHPAFRSKTA